MRIPIQTMRNIFKKYVGAKWTVDGITNFIDL